MVKVLVEVDNLLMVYYLDLSNSMTQYSPQAMLELHLCVLISSM